MFLDFQDLGELLKKKLHRVRNTVRPGVVTMSMSISEASRSLDDLDD